MLGILHHLVRIEQLFIQLFTTILFILINGDFNRGLPIVLGPYGDDPWSFERVGDNAYYSRWSEWETPLLDPLNPSKELDYNWTVTMEISVKEPLKKEFLEWIRVVVNGRKGGDYVQSETTSICFVFLFSFFLLRIAHLRNVPYRLFGGHGTCRWIHFMEGRRYPSHLSFVFYRIHG